MFCKLNLGRHRSVKTPSVQCTHKPKTEQNDLNILWPRPWTRSVAPAEELPRSGSELRARRDIGMRAAASGFSRLSPGGPRVAHKQKLQIASLGGTVHDDDESCGGCAPSSASSHSTSQIHPPESRRQDGGRLRASGQRGRDAKPLTAANKAAQDRRMSGTAKHSSYTKLLQGGVEGVSNLEPRAAKLNLIVVACILMLTGAALVAYAADALVLQPPHTHKSSIASRDRHQGATGAPTAGPPTAAGRLAATPPPPSLQPLLPSSDAAPMVTPSSTVLTATEPSASSRPAPPCPSPSPPPVLPPPSPQSPPPPQPLPSAPSPSPPDALSLRVDQINGRFHTPPWQAAWDASGLLPEAVRVSEAASHKTHPSRCPPPLDGPS